MKEFHLGFIRKVAGDDEVSSYTQDFLGGVDPFGFATSAYGVSGEKAKLPEAEHAKKRTLATLGGILGGATVVPSAIFGLIQGIKGVATTPGTIGQKLTGGAAGFMQGAKTPLMGPIKAFRARKALKEVADKGRLTPEAAQAVKDVGEFVPIAEVLSKLPKGESSPAAKKLMEELGGMESSGIIGQIRGAHRANKAIKALSPEERMAIEEARKLPEFLETLSAGKSVELSPQMQEQAGKLYEASALPLAETLSAMGLGGTVGGLGAFVQYGKGRSARREFEQELKQEPLKPSNTPKVPRSQDVSKLRAKDTSGLGPVDRQAIRGLGMPDISDNLSGLSAMRQRTSSGMSHEDHRDLMRKAYADE